MRKKFLRSTIRNVLRFFLLLQFFALPTFATAKKKEVWPFDKIKITLKDSRTIDLKRMPEDHTWKLSLNTKNKKVLWSKIYSQDFDSLWEWAFFVRVKKGMFVYDLNKDGYPESAISTWDGGNAPYRPAIIFTIKEKELVVFKVINEYPFESGELVSFSTKNGQIIYAAFDTKLSSKQAGDLYPYEE